MSIKRGKWERKAAKAEAMPAAPPAPQDSIAMAASGIDLNRGNANQIPLSEPGQNIAAKTAEQLADKGGLDAIVKNTSKRVEQTSAPIIAKNPDQNIAVKTDPNLESWAQGNLEGQPMAQVKNQIRDMIRKTPQRAIPGQGAMSTRPGESFDQFRQRALPAIRGIMQQFADGIAKDPGHKIGVPLHSTVIKLIKAWIDKGAPDDFAVNPAAMDKEVEPPGGVERLFPNKNGDWEIKDAKMDEPGPLPAGIYLIRHAPTPISLETYQKGAAQQTALAKLTQRVGALDFNRAREFAKKASDAGMSDDDIGSYMDSALPDKETAAQLPMHHLLAVMSAAGPQKRAEYTPLVQSHFGNLTSLPSEDRQAIAGHLAASGYPIGETV